MQSRAGGMLMDAMRCEMVAVGVQTSSELLSIRIGFEAILKRSDEKETMIKGHCCCACCACYYCCYCCYYCCCVKFAFTSRVKTIRVRAQMALQFQRRIQGDFAQNMNFSFNFYKAIRI